MNGFLHIRLFPFCQYWQNTDGGNCIRDQLLRSLLAFIKSGGPYLFCRVHHFVYLLLLLLDAGSIAKQVDSIGAHQLSIKWPSWAVTTNPCVPSDDCTIQSRDVRLFVCVTTPDICRMKKKKGWAREINATDQIRFSILPRNVLDNFALGFFSLLCIDEKVRWYWISCRRTHEASCKKRKLNFTKYDLPSGALLLLALTWKKSKRIWNWYTYTVYYLINNRNCWRNPPTGGSIFYIHDGNF